MPLLILVAEDDLATRLAINDYLEDLGYNVLAAMNGKDALALLHQFHPHLVITDVMMPEMDGYGLIRQIRQDPALRLLPVVFLTARDATQERVMGYQLGCDVYLPKPFELEELGAIVRNLLERSQVVQSEWQFQRQRSPLEGNHPFALTQARGEQSEDSAPALGGKSATNGIENDFQISDRERQILTLLSQGDSNNQIGNKLHLSPRTIEKYVSRLLRKTDTNNRADLVRFAIEHHLIQV